MYAFHFSLRLVAEESGDRRWEKNIYIYIVSVICNRKSNTLKIAIIYRYINLNFFRLCLAAEELIDYDLYSVEFEIVAFPLEFRFLLDFLFTNFKFDSKSTGMQVDWIVASI